MANAVVLFWGKAGYQIGPRGTPRPDTAPRTGAWGYDVHGAYMTPWYAMWAQRYMHDFGVTNADLAQVAVTHRYHATLNPDLVMGRRGEITVDDVLGSRVVASPLHLLDCAIDNDGGYAIVIPARRLHARQHPRRPAVQQPQHQPTIVDRYWCYDPSNDPRSRKPAH
jgi:acetyl-CoA C-acetyltransferase